MLACYLLSVQSDPTLGSLGRLGVKKWLEKELPKYTFFPVQKSCMEKAIALAPKIEAELAAAQAAAAPKPSFSDDDDDEEEEEEEVEALDPKKPNVLVRSARL